MAELKQLVESHPATLMIWEGTPEPESLARLKSIGIESVVFDPCANVPQAGDWISVMRSNIEAMDSIAVDGQ